MTARPLVLVALALFAAGCSCGESTVRARPSISADPPSLDFGTVAGGTTARLTLKLVNDGAAPLTVESVAVVDDAAGHFGVEGAPATIAPASSAEVVVTFAAPAVESAEAAALEVVSDAENAPTLRVPLLARSPRPCVPATCASLGLDCDARDDGCGGTISCGGCTFPKTCGGGGTPNVCGCTPESSTAFCARLGKDCGQVTDADNCGATRTVTCGTCTLPKICGGANDANVCAEPLKLGLCERKFCWENPTPDGNHHLAVWPFASNDVWITAEQFLLHYDGAKFSAVDLGLGNDAGVEALWGFGPKDLWAAGCYGVLHHYDGTTWTKGTGVPAGNCSSAVWGADPSDVWAVGQYSETLRGQNGTWATAAKAFSSSYNARDVAGVSTGDAWAVGANASTARLSGGTWQLVSNPVSATNPGWTASLESVFPVTSSEAWAVGYQGANALFLHYTAGSWQKAAVTFYGQPWSIWGDSGLSLWAVGTRGSVVHYGGASWDAEVTGTTADLYAVRGTDASEVWAVGSGGEILRRTGGKWASLAPAATREDLYAMWGASPTDVRAVGNRGAIARFDGKKWQAEASNQSALYYLTGIWGSAANDVWTVGADATGGVILHNTGNGWQRATLPGGVTGLRDVWGSSATNVWAVGDNQRIFHFNGAGWTETIHPGSNAGSTLMKVQGGGGKAWAITQSAVLHFDGTSWKTLQSNASDDYAALWVTGTTAFIGGRMNGGADHLLKWNGTAFSAVALPVTPGKVTALWGTGATDYWLADDHGLVLHFNGTGFESVPNPSHNFVGWAGVWGSGAGDVRLFGYAGAILRYTP